MRKYKAQDGYILRTIAGSNVLISIGGNIANFNGYIQLNDTAAFIWKKIQDEQTAEKLAEALSQEFSVSKEEADADVREFLDDLLREGMVVYD